MAAKTEVDRSEPFRVFRTGVPRSEPLSNRMTEHLPSIKAASLVSCAAFNALGLQVARNSQGFRR